MPEVPVFETLGAEDPYHYRNKAQVPVREIDGQLQTGFFKMNSHDLIPLEDFQIQDPEEIEGAIIAVRNLLRTYGFKAYDEANHKGIVRHIMVRRGYYTPELIKGILEELPETVSIIQNGNTEKRM